jgi:hypothetical protein
MALPAQRVLPRQPSLNKKASTNENHGAAIASIAPAKGKQRVREVHGSSGKYRIAPSRKMVALA